MMCVPVFPQFMLLAAATAALLSLPTCSTFRHGVSNDFLLPRQSTGSSSSSITDDDDVMLVPVDGATGSDPVMGPLQPYLMLPFASAIHDALLAQEGGYLPLSPQDDSDQSWPDKRTAPQPSVGKRIKQLNKNARDQYYRLLNQQQPTGGATGTGSWQQPRDLKRERPGSGSSLSVDSSLDLIRQRFMQELRRKQTANNKQKQINSNQELLSDIGKRDTHRSSGATYRRREEATQAPPLGGSLDSL